MKPELFIFAIPAAKLSGDWRETLEKRADASSLEYDIRAQRIRLWNPHSKPGKTPRKDVIFRDGIQIQRMNLGDRRDPPAVGVSICRLYFHPGDQFPAIESHAELFTSGSTPVILKHIPFLEEARSILNELNQPDPFLLPLEDIAFSEAHSSMALHFGANRTTSLTGLTRSGYSKSILGQIRGRPAVSPSSLDLALLPSFSSNEPKAKDHAKQIANVLQNEWGCSITKALIKTEDDLQAWLKRSTSGNPIVYIPLDGKKGDRPSAGAMDWFRRLTDEGVSFQLGSTQSDPTYARHGAACAILSKTGGCLFHTDTPSVPKLEEHWCIGLDLGFGGEYDAKIAVMTLTDGLGRLRAYWRAIKDTDETLSEEVLRDGLGWIVEQAETLAPNRDFIVFRDGIRPKHETLSLYREFLPTGRSCLVEFAKQGNPLFLKDNAPPQPGTLAIPEGTETGFIYPITSPVPGVLTNTVKFFSPLNNLGYSLNQIAELITALCYAPKLSFQPSSLPAPIYWADGLAGLSATNLQFGGWSHLPNRTRDLRPTGD